MNVQVDTAVLNNIVWCGIVCDTHGIARTSRENVWGVLTKAPTFYPDIITSSRHVTIEEVNNFIGNREISSVKDSFANLDLSLVGFKILFEAEWIYHAPVANLELFQSAWRVITTENDLAQWTFAHGSGNVIRPELLKRGDVRIFTHEKEGEIAGFIANLGANAVGISNVFSPVNANENLWSDIAKVVSIEFPGLPLVGYEQDGDLTAALLSGWTSIGPLRVWLKSNN
jgi:hypothetical protein